MIKFPKPGQLVWYYYKTIWTWGTLDTLETEHPVRVLILEKKNRESTKILFKDKVYVVENHDMFLVKSDALKAQEKFHKKYYIDSTNYDESYGQVHNDLTKKQKNSFERARQRNLFKSSKKSFK